MPRTLARTRDIGSLARGKRVFLRHPEARDREEFLDAVRASRRLHRPWVYFVSTPEAFKAYLARTRGDDFKSFFACAIDTGEITSVLNLSQIFRGGFQNAYLGYSAFVPHAGRGYTKEALGLVVRYAFGPLKLHRIEANIQPGNEASRAIVRLNGFHLEGFSPRYLKIGGRWRDHERWAITREEVSAPRAAPSRPR